VRGGCGDPPRTTLGPVMKRPLGGLAGLVCLACALAVLVGRGEAAEPSQAPGGKHQPNPRVTGAIKLADLPASGVKVLEGFTGRPDGEPWGVLGTYELALPAFTKGVFYAHANGNAAGWPNMMNRGFPYPFAPDPKVIAQLRDGGIFFILELKDGGCLAVTALAGAKTQSWFHTDESGRILMSFGTFGTAAVDGDAPLFSWGRADDVSGACHGAMAAALASKPMAGRARFRGEKAYPEPLKYLGWCSWEHFHGNIDEQNLLGAIDGIEASGLPIRYVVVDMGHTSVERGAMNSFGPDAKKFPNGWAPLLARRKPEKIRWMGLWHYFTGSNNGLSPNNDFPEGLRQHLEPFSEWSLMPRNDPASSLAFYRAFMGSVKAYGFDFVKTDFQSMELARLAGKVDNAVQRCVANSQAFDASLEELGLGLINCNWHNPANFWNCRFSSIGRCSIDYSKNSLPSAKQHLFQSYANILWLGQLVWGDHDMFHSSHEGVGGIMAVSKAMSGGPVYLSDPPEAFVADFIKPLCYADGELLRPLAPAAPLPDSVFIDPLREESPYRVVAPLAGGSAAVVAYNLFGKGSATATLKASVTAADYASAGGMVQPYQGDWKVPEDGLLVYDWQTGKGQKLGDAYTFELAGFADRLVHLCPIRNGWAVVGRTDKYLSPAAVEVRSVSDARLELRLVESGPLAVWSEKGAPRAEGVVFVPAGEGLYKADLPVGKRDAMLSITR